MITATLSAIQRRVFEQYGIVTTVGIGENPLLAKLALDNAAKKQAPWQAFWGYATVPETLWKISKLTDFWGIGSRTAAHLDRIGITSIYELAHADQFKLRREFGVLGDQLYYHAWGIDYSDLTRRYLPRSKNKGYGNSQVLMRDYVQKTEIETVLSEIADQVATRLRKHQVQAEVISISIGFAEPDDTGRSGYSKQTKIDPTDQTADLIAAVHCLFEQIWQGWPLRNVGVRAHRISSAAYLQTDLFRNPEKQVQAVQF